MAKNDPIGESIIVQGWPDPDSPILYAADDVPDARSYIDDCGTAAAIYRYKQFEPGPDDDVSGDCDGILDEPELVEYYESPDYLAAQRERESGN